MDIRKDCIIVYQSGAAVMLRATRLTIDNKETLATIFDGNEIMAVIPITEVKTIILADCADAKEIIAAINGAEDEEATESAPPYKEKDTLCDTCLHLQECIENGNVIDVTACCDSRKHYIKALGADCSGFGEYFYSHEIAKADK